MLLHAVTAIIGGYICLWALNIYLYVLFSRESNVSISVETTLDGFIAETQNTLDLMIETYGKSWSKVPVKLYNLTDVVSVEHRSMHSNESSQFIDLNGFCILTRCRNDYIQIASCEGINGLFVAVHYPRHPLHHLNAHIVDLNAVLVPAMTGTEVLLLIHHILSRLGVKWSSLLNCAKLYYQYQSTPNSTAITTSIPLIHLRCIRGKISDWYSEFGYFNQNKDQIANEMHNIYHTEIKDSSHSNRTLGPWLFALWNKSDKTDFHRAYQYYLWRYQILTELRKGKWVSYFD